MTYPSSAREALIVEALGNVAQLLDRVEALTLSVNAARIALDSASAKLHGDLKALDADIQVVTHQAKVAMVDHVLKRVNKAASEAMATQAQAMTSAARLAFSDQAESNLPRLIKLLQNALQRIDRPWEVWMTHAATACASGFLTWCVYRWLAFR